jgi:ferredoxin
MARRKKSFSRYQVRVDSAACIGCVARARCDLFVIGSDVRAHAVHAELRNVGRCREVADACPVGAILINPIPNPRRR